MPATPACDPPAPAQPLRHSRSGPPALFRGAFKKKKKFAADFLSEALFLSRFSSFTEPVTCKSIGVRARVHEEKRGSCVLCECGGGFLKKEEEWGGGGGDPSSGSPGPEPIGGARTRTARDATERADMWSLEPPPAACTSGAARAEFPPRCRDQKIPLGLKSDLQQATIGPET